MEISLELVPRDEDYIREQILFVEKNIPQISTINFPDLLRFDIRAWEACSMIRHTSLERIAHIRAIDFDLDEVFPLIDYLNENQIKKVLIISGDEPADPAHKIHSTSSIDFIRKLRKEIDGIKVYAAFDPYRYNIRFELDYLFQKIDAGASGFFSQPFFDLRLLEIYSEYLEGMDVFWGISPVTSEKSRLYWENRNRAIFPKGFSPTLDWNVRFGKQVIDFCQEHQFNLYLMPIKTNLEDYLTGLFGINQVHTS